MDLKLKDKVALIGGSSKGLGKGCAFQLAKEGVNVVICARRKEFLDKTKEEIEKTTNSKVLAIQADLSKANDINRVIDKTIETFGRIDILVNNSGGPPSGNFFSFTEDAWKESFESVLLYVIRMYYKVIPYMKKQKWGRIINISSVTVKEPVEELVLSNVFRVGVISLAKTLSKELIDYNITINNICPGAFKTDRAVELMSEKSKRTKKSLEDIEKEIILNLPLKRFQTPEELGNLVAFLSSDLAGGINGTTIQIDGGIIKSLF